MIRLPESAVRPAEDACTEAVRRVLGAHLTKDQASRITRRVLLAYTEARMGKAGSRIKSETEQIMAMEIGDVLEVTATCKANLHGQFKTIRRLKGDVNLKWKVNQLQATLWRVERLPPDANPMKKNPRLNPKAIFFAGLPLGKWMPSPFSDCRKCNQLNTDFTKNKAREIIGNMAASWECKSTPKGLMVRRVC